MITQARVKELLEYNPLTGLFTRKVTRPGSARVGSVAGGKTSTGYIRIKIDDVEYMAHRLVWLYVYGHFPSNQIDHINCIRNDNRLLNLRAVTYSENGQNQRKAQSDNKIGLLGVSLLDGRWRASIRVNGKNIHLGKYPTPELAHAAYISAKRKLHTACTI